MPRNFGMDKNRREERLFNPETADSPFGDWPDFRKGEAEYMPGLFVLDVQTALFVIAVFCFIAVGICMLPLIMRVFMPGH